MRYITIECVINSPRECVDKRQSCETIVAQKAVQNL